MELSPALISDLANISRTELTVTQTNCPSQLSHFGHWHPSCFLMLGLETVTSSQGLTLPSFLSSMSLSHQVYPSFYMRHRVSPRPHCFLFPWLWPHSRSIHLVAGMPQTLLTPAPSFSLVFSPAIPHVVMSPSSEIQSMTTWFFCSASDNGCLLSDQRFSSLWLDGFCSFVFQ